MAAFLVAMTGCQKESPAEQAGGEIAAGEKIYMELKIQAVDTRSGSDGTIEDGNFTGGTGDTNSNAAPDYEVGKNYENTISSVDVVLRNADKFIVASNVVPTAKDGGWLATFNSGAIAAGEKYLVYIYANCSASQNLDATSKASIEEITGISGTGDGKTGKFWMTNAYTATEVTVDELSTDSTKPTMLGTHFVERSMARFDYMAVKDGNVYTLTDEKNNGIKVTLTHAAIINQSREFYLLRHATKSGNTLGTNNSNVVIGYPEIASNYVVDTDWTAKSTAFNSNPKDYSTIVGNFDYHLSTPEDWSWKSLSSFTEEDNDNLPGTAGGATGITPSHSTYGDYKIFGYVKENTLPDVNSQVNGMSTGVVFKGQITDNGIDGVITTAAGKDIYMFDGKLYGVWANVVEAAKTSEVLKYYVDKFDETIESSEYAALASAGFTRYSAEKDGNYYAYYYYWNRHNDNEDNKAMGAMEFAVVRNNVYKLCVDYITKLGHPTPGAPDPDPVDPEDPNESGEYYFGVSVKVVPWVVRVNHIGW